MKSFAKYLSTYAGLNKNSVLSDAYRNALGIDFINFQQTENFNDQLGKFSEIWTKTITDEKTITTKNQGYTIFEFDEFANDWFKKYQALPNVRDAAAADPVFAEALTKAQNALNGNDPNSDFFTILSTIQSQLTIDPTFEQDYVPNKGRGIFNFDNFPFYVKTEDGPWITGLNMSVPYYIKTFEAGLDHNALINNIDSLLTKNSSIASLKNELERIKAGGLNFPFENYLLYNPINAQRETVESFYLIDKPGTSKTLNAISLETHNFFINQNRGTRGNVRFSTLEP
jgi:hypothetical protein